MISFKQYLREEIINTNVVVFNTYEDKKVADRHYAPGGGPRYKGEFIFLRNGDLVIPPLHRNSIINGDLILEKCKDLTSLAGCPHHIEGSFMIDFYSATGSNLNKVTSLLDAPKIVKKDCVLMGCTGITSLKGIGTDYLIEVGLELLIPNTIQSNILGILKIQNLRSVSNSKREIPLYEAIKIINKHLSSGKNINKCKSELKEAGLEEYAQL